MAVAGPSREQGRLARARGWSVRPPLLAGAPSLSRVCWRARLRDPAPTRSKAGAKGAPAKAAPAKEAAGKAAPAKGGAKGAPAKAAPAKEAAGKAAPAKGGAKGKGKA